MRRASRNRCPNQHRGRRFIDMRDLTATTPAQPANLLVDAIRLGVEGFTIRGKTGRYATHWRVVAPKALPRPKNRASAFYAAVAAFRKRRECSRTLPTGRTGSSPRLAHLRR